MSIYTDNPNLFNQLLRLSEDEKADPNLVFSEFFVDYSLSECRDWLLKIVTTCVTDSGIEFDEADKRSDLLHFAERLEAILEATALSAQQYRTIPESAQPVENSKETKAGSNDNIDLDGLQTKVVDLQLQVAELVSMIIKARSGAIVDPLC